VTFSSGGLTVRITPGLIRFTGVSCIGEQSYQAAHLTSFKVIHVDKIVEVKKGFFKTKRVRNNFWSVDMRFGTGFDAPAKLYYAKNEADARQLEAALRKAISSSERRTPPPHYPEYDDDGNELDEFGDPVD